MEVQQGKLINQEESLKRSIAELFRPIISSIPNPADQEQLEKNCQSFTHQLINYLNQYQQPQQQQQPQQPQQPQINPSQKENTLKRRRTESLDAKTQLLVNHRARSEPNNNNNPARLNPTLNIQRSDTQPKPTKAIPSAAREATITETHDHHPTDQQPSELESTTLHPTSNLIQEDDQEDPISDDLRLFIQNEIECGFDDMAYQFDDSLKDAKRELIMLNREYLEDLLEKLKGNDSSTSQNHIPPIPPTSPPTKIEAGSIGEKLKFKFENHLIDCYQDYLKQFVFAIGYSGLGTEPFDFQVHHHHQPDQPAPSEAQLDHKTPVIDPKDEESVVIKTKIESPSKEDLERNSLAIEKLVEEKLRSNREEIGRMVDEKVKSYNEEIGRMVEEKVRSTTEKIEEKLQEELTSNRTKVGLDDEKKLMSINQKIEEQLKEKIGEISAKTEQLVQGMLMSNSQKIERHIEEKLRPISEQTERIIDEKLTLTSQKIERHIQEELKPISEETERIIDERLTLTSQKIERQIQEELRPISKETEKMMDEKLISTSRKIERQIEEKLRPINEETEKIVQEKLNSYHKGLEKHAVEYRKGIRSEIVQCKEEMSKDLDSLIDQIEGLFLGEKDKLVNLHKQTDGLQQRIKRLEGVIEKETDPVLRRTSVLVSLGLIDSDHINQKLNLNIFLTKLNAHLKVNLGQIDIRDPERNPRIPLLQPHDHHEPESRPGTSNDPNQANTDINNSNTPRGSPPAIPSDPENLFFEKLIIKLLLRINETIRLQEEMPNGFDEEAPVDQDPHQDSHQDHPLQDQHQHQPPHQDQAHQKQDRQTDQSLQTEPHPDTHTFTDNQQLAHPGEEPSNHPNHHHCPPSNAINPLNQHQAQDINQVLQEFFDLNFRKFVWPKFSNLVFHLEQYLARGQISIRASSNSTQVLLWAWGTHSCREGLASNVAHLA
ncbi:hypothetical protein PGTUg99_033414 [Puccinia graminis f. sp. tritici]|uniref:Uncharacterized protein n=1 Tax=Puccinia graminis f. sp. tritici TaxID=56615 RepID=A0A5B0RF20_PUCGR|nr:hypothetical protein PGTUg99_033414 [Puccinia graminis f. sp. tritici]